MARDREGRQTQLLDSQTGRTSPTSSRNPRRTQSPARLLARLGHSLCGNADHTHRSRHSDSCILTRPEGMLLGMTTMSKKDAEPFRWRFKAFTITALALILCLASWWALVRFISTWTDRANFGQMFGAVNALFSGLALAGVVVAILMQKEELELQREELIATRQELKRQAAAQESSSRAVENQVQLMLVAAKLNAHSMLAAYYTAHHHSAPLGGDRFQRSTYGPKSDFHRNWRLTFKYGRCNHYLR